MRPRVLALVLITQTVMIWWVADSEMARGIYLICYSLMMPTVLYLLLAHVLKRWLPFEEKELLLGYIVLTATIPVMGYGGLRFLIEGMGAVPFLARNQPQWIGFVPLVDRLPVLRDPEAVRGLYLGGAGVPWRAWAMPIVFWSVYLLSLGAIWLSLAAILRRIWIHQERLTFPIAMLPLRMTDPGERIFRRPLFIIGFAIPVALQSLLVVHQWVPSVPALPLKAFNAAPLLFSSPPWNAIPSLPVGFYPMAIGLAYFVPSDVSFSCWFLALAMRFVYVGGAILGKEGGDAGASRFPYKEEQASGAWIAFAVLVIWGARRHWRSVVSMVPADELATVRRMTAVALGCIGLCAGMMALVGIPIIAAAGVIVVYVLYVLSGARVRAVAGGQWTFAPLFWTPHRVMYSVLGTETASNRALLAGGYFHLVHVDVRAQSLPYLMEGLDIAERSGIRWRTVLVWVAIGTVTAVAIGWWSTLTEIYSLGAATAKADYYALRKVNVAFNEVDHLATSPGSWDLEGVSAMGFGAGVTVLLAWSRRLGVFGLHPVGYVLCNTLTMGGFIVPFFIAWLVKSVMLRLGNKTYRQSVPFFVGVILGDVVIQAGWALVGGIFKVPIYQFLT